MASEDDIRELIGRMSGAQRQGFHVTPAAAAVILAALRFYLSARQWLKEPASNRPERPVRKSEPYTGPLPTIRETRSHGVVACVIECAGPNCWNQKRFTFDELGLADDLVFVHIPRLRRFGAGDAAADRFACRPTGAITRRMGRGGRRFDPTYRERSPKYTPKTSTKRTDPERASYIDKSLVIPAIGAISP